MAGRRGREEESVYAWGGLLPDATAAAPGGGPRVQAFAAAAPRAAPRARMHEDSSQVEAVLKPVRGIRDAQRRAGITPTNHSRLNVQAVKEQSRLNALQKQQECAAAAAPAGARPALRRPASMGAGPRPAPAERPDAQQQQLDSGGGSGRNFVAENKAAAAAAAASRPVKAEARRDGGSYLDKAEYGQVPAYLLARKLQLAQQHEARMAAKAAAQIPAGLRQLPESERLATLALLEQNKAEVEAQLAALPIIIETPSQVRHKDALERRLCEIEEGRRIFSRPAVLVAATTVAGTL